MKKLRPDENWGADESVVPPDQRVLAAVSSGADSMALLFWLHALGRDFVVGHVHHDLHELRPGQCEADETFVREKCRELDVPFLSRQIDLPRQNGHVNENIARDGRYRALTEMAHQEKCLRVATAHTATDGLETLLLNLMRGAGPGGWLGPSPSRVLSEKSGFTSEILLVRPLWRTAREATRQILRGNGWSWREDESNRSALFRRNRVRHEVLPLLGDISGQNPDDLAIRAVQNARFARDEGHFLEKMAQYTLDSLLIQQENDLIVLNGEAFAAHDIALQRRVLRCAARRLDAEARSLEWPKIEATRLAVIGAHKRQVWMWRKGLHVEWTGPGAGNRLRFRHVKMSLGNEIFPQNNITE